MREATTKARRRRDLPFDLCDIIDEFYDRRELVDVGPSYSDTGTAVVVTVMQWLTDVDSIYLIVTRFSVVDWVMVRSLALFVGSFIRLKIVWIKMLT